MERISKLLGFFAISLTLFIASCENDLVNVTREEAQINILLNNVLSSFTAYNQSDMDMYVGGNISSKIMVKAFVYDDSGYLINSFSKEIADYNQSSVSFTTTLTGSNPQIVCFTYATFTISQGITYNAYKISGEESLSTLKILNDYASFVDNIPWQVLGGAIKSIGLGSEKVDVEVKPLGGLAYLDWTNIHVHDGEANAPQRYAMMQKFNDIATIKDGKFSYSSTLSTNYYFIADIYPAKHPSYNGLYIIRFMFPSNVESFGYGAYSPSNFNNDDDEVRTGTSNTKTIKVDAGKQYVIKMDCQNYSLNAWEGILED